VLIPQLQSWRWFLRSSSVIVSSKGKKIKTKQKKKTTISCPKFKCNTVSVSFSACRYSSIVVSSKEGRKKKESGDSSVNGYLRLQLTCPLLSACCCWRQAKDKPWFSQNQVLDVHREGYL
jgi:hypothetical protein